MVCVPHPGFSVPFIAQDHDGKIGRLLKLENEHHQSLKRLDEAESMWRKLVQGTPIESLYSANYAGMFRNPAAKPDAAPTHIQRTHLSGLLPRPVPTKCHGDPGK